MARFEVAEYRERLGRTKERMAAAGLDVLLCTSPGNMNYLSGYDGWSFYVHQLIAVAATGDEPVWIGRELDLAGARLTVWLGEENIRGYPDRYLQSRARHPMSFVAEVLREKGWSRGTVGVEMDDFYFTARAHEALKAALPEARIRDADFLVDWVRIVKSPREIAYMREAGRIVAGAMEKAIETIAPGVRECDAAAEVYRAQIAGTPAFGGDYTACAPSMPTGERTAAPHFTWTDEPYRAGTATTLELAGSRYKYHSAMSRSLHLGPPPRRLAELAEIVVEGFHVAFDAMRPGVTCEEVDAVWRRHVARHGLEKATRIGYSIGLNYPPDWGERTASLRPGDTTVLAPDMTFHLIPAIWMGDWGFVLSETVRVTAAGAESLIEFPRRLFVKP